MYNNMFSEFVQSKEKINSVLDQYNTQQFFNNETYDFIETVDEGSMLEQLLDIEQFDPEELEMFEMGESPWIDDAVCTIVEEYIDRFKEMYTRCTGHETADIDIDWTYTSYIHRGTEGKYCHEDHCIEMAYDYETMLWIKTLAHEVCHYLDAEFEKRLFSNYDHNREVHDCNTWAGDDFYHWYIGTKEEEYRAETFAAMFFKDKQVQIDDMVAAFEIDRKETDKLFETPFYQSPLLNK